MKEKKGARDKARKKNLSKKAITIKIIIIRTIMLAWKKRKRSEIKHGHKAFLL